MTLRAPHRLARLAVLGATLVVLDLSACESDPIVIGIERAPIVTGDASARASDAGGSLGDGGVPDLSPPPGAPSDPGGFAWDAAPTSCLPDGGCPGAQRCYWPPDASDSGGLCYGAPPMPPPPPPGGGGGV